MLCKRDQTVLKSILKTCPQFCDATTLPSFKTIAYKKPSFWQAYEAFRNDTKKSLTMAEETLLKRFRPYENNVKL